MVLLVLVLQTHGEDVHATRQEVLHLRQELESTFRKTLKDLGGTYRRKVADVASEHCLKESDAAFGVWKLGVEAGLAQDAHPIYILARKLAHLPPLKAALGSNASSCAYQRFEQKHR